MDGGRKDLGLAPAQEPRKETKKLEFTKTPAHVKKDRAWQMLHLEAITNNSKPKPDGFLDMDKIDKDTLSEYYRRKAAVFLEEDLPDKIKNDEFFRDALKAFGREEALKQYFYREDLKIEAREEIRKIIEERERKKEKLD